MRIKDSAIKAGMCGCAFAWMAVMHMHSISAIDLDSARAYIQIRPGLLFEQPERHFYIENYAYLHAPHPEGESIAPCVYKLAVDLNGDGQPEYFFSNNDPWWRDAQQGQSWQVYVSSPEGYRLSRDGISFSRTTTYIETYQGTQYLMRFSSAGGRRGSILRIRAAEGDLAVDNLGEVSLEDTTTFEELLEQLDGYDLASSTLEPIEAETLSVEDLQQAHPDVNEHSNFEFALEALQQYYENE